MESDTEGRQMTPPLRPLIVGQSPSRHSDPSEPLSGRSGAYLAELCDLTLPQFLDRFDRINLSVGWMGKAAKGDRYFTVREARDRAGVIRAAFLGRQVVVLGAINAAAFGLHWSKLWFRAHWGGSFAWCPHPSPINLFWNDPLNVEAARLFWSSLARGHDPAQLPLPLASSTVAPPGRAAPPAGRTSPSE